MPWAVASSPQQEKEAMDIVISAAGFSVGVVIGLTGIGGGSLMTPLLILIFGVAPSTAVGTDLLFAAATKGLGTMLHGWNRTVDWRVVGWLALGSIPTALAVIALHYNNRHPEFPCSSSHA